MIRYQNKTYEDISSQLFPDPKVKEFFNDMDERKKDKLSPYIVTLDGKIVKAFGDIQSVDGQKAINFETTYGDVIRLVGKRTPETTNLNFIIEYDHEIDNITQMQDEVSKWKKLKKDRTPIAYAVSEINIDMLVTIETLTIRYRGVRDIYINMELVEAYENDNIS